jgi:uncharacterized protein YkwD
MTRRPRGRFTPVALSAVLLAVLAISASSAPVRASTASDAESLVINLINADRVKAGLVPLRSHWDLASISGYRASKMAQKNVMSHSVGGSLGAQLNGRGVVWYRYGEAIAYTTKSWATTAARELHRVWMASAPHRALLMSSKFNYVGVGLALRSSNSRTFGSVVLSESLDENGARSWFTDVDVVGDDIRWAWAGADLQLQTHTAGLRDFDVQYRSGSSGWKTLRNDSTSRSATLWNRTRGVTYAMRVRATDRRGNVGAWTPEIRVKLP